MRKLVLAAALLWPAIAVADDAVFDAGAAMIPFDQRLVKAVTFDPTLAKIRIVAVSALAREPVLPPEEATYQKFYQDAGVYMAYPLDVKLRADQDYLVLRCDSGGSNDPQCVFSTSQNPEKEGVAVPGLLFVMPGDGCVYSAGHTDNMFNARALHCLKDGKLEPVAQPFSYAGLRSKALKELTLYSDKNNSGVVTKIATGQPVEVILQDGDYFLLRDRFGLTGWAKLEQTQQPTEIEDLFYNGD